MTDHLARTLGITALLACCGVVQAAPLLSGGVWMNYRYITDSDFQGVGVSDDFDRETGGTLGDPALILYANDQGQYGSTRFAAEVRAGKGSFTDPDNNGTGDYLAFKEAWVGRELDNGMLVRVGKMAVPFGYKTVNFWPGDLLQGGYGDQMDVGVGLEGTHDTLHYALAYLHADDFGETSTDTMDDNGHWGQAACNSATTGDCDLAYRKMQTVAGTLDWQFLESHTLGLSAQSGRLQDLAATEDQSPTAIERSARLSGRHHAVDLHYSYRADPWLIQARHIEVQRELPGRSEKVRNHRQSLSAGYTHNNWFMYLDLTSAATRTRGNDTDRVYAWAPGVRYDYGPGWVYLEYLWSDGDIGRDGDIYAADFRALYATVDFYF